VLGAVSAAGHRPIGRRNLQQTHPGPGLGGWLAGLAGAANVLGVQAVTVLASAVSLTALRTAEPPAPRALRHLLADIRHGLRLVAGDRVLRALAASSAVSNLAFAVASAVTVIFGTRDLRLTPAAIGAMVAAGALATVLGAALTPWLGRRLGPDRTVWLSLAATSPLALLSTLARPGWWIVLAVAGGTAGELSQIVYAITSLSLRQRRCPPAALSRVNATMRFLAMGMLPLGALLGGVLGDHLGPRLTLLASQALVTAAVVPAYRALHHTRDTTEPHAGRLVPRPESEPEPPDRNEPYRFVSAPVRKSMSPNGARSPRHNSMIMWVSAASDALRGNSVCS
jgi:hypothetical protein